MPFELGTVVLPEVALPDDPPAIPAATYEARSRAAYARAGCDWLVVYGDREHVGNIAFLSGFDPRFEEAFLLLGPGDRRVLVTGNECESYAVLAGLPGMTVLLAQSLSLMAQDRTRAPRLQEVFRDAGLKSGDTIGLVGWKYLEPEEADDLAGAFFVPAVHVRMMERIVGPAGTIRDATVVLMHQRTGLRAVVDADQIAAWEWASTRCTQAVWRVLEAARPGDTERDALARMGDPGGPVNVHAMFSVASAGEALVGLRSPTGRRLKRGDGITAAIGVWGALGSRAGLLDDANPEFERLAAGYVAGLATWYETADVGVAGGDLHAAVVETLAAAGLRSALNPGHLTGHEEWMNSPVRPGSTDRLCSGMPFQVDVIPVPQPDGWAMNCEDPVAFADTAMQADLSSRHPGTWARIEARRAFMRDVLGVNPTPGLLPLSATPMVYAPFWLTPGRAFVRR